jgi:protein-S-isoprenylcysteine O-methyltransferase Ste14
MAEAARVEEAVVGELPRKRICRRRFYRWRVPIGYAVGAAALLLAQPTELSVLLALIFILPGQGLRLWASGHIEKTRRLATGGPYRHTQHPLYLGSFAIALGVAVASARPSVVLVVIAYILAFYPYVICDEREFLHRRFGREFELWAAEVPLFFPRISPGGPRATRFAWNRMLSNGEWRSCLAPPMALGLLHLKERLLPFLE